MKQLVVFTLKRLSSLARLALVDLFLFLVLSVGCTTSRTIGIVSYIEDDSKQPILDLIDSGYQKCTESYDSQMEIPHITLKTSFESSEIDKIEGILEDVASRFRPFSVTLEGYDEFDHFEVIYIKAMGDSLLNLEQTIVEELQKAGIAATSHDKVYNPHITLALHPKNKACFISYFNEIRSKPLPIETVTVHGFSMSFRTDEGWELRRTFAFPY